MLRTEGTINKLLEAVGLHSLSQAWLTNPSIVIWTIAIVSIWQSAGFQMAIYLAGLQSISQEYYEAATIDGASSWKSFFKITLPLLLPAININLMLTLIGGLKVFSEVYVMTGGVRVMLLRLWVPLFCVPSVKATGDSVPQSIHCCSSLSPLSPFRC